MIDGLLITILVLAMIGVPGWIIASDLDADERIDNQW